MCSGQSVLLLRELEDGQKRSVLWAIEKCWGDLERYDVVRISEFPRRYILTPLGQVVGDGIFVRKLDFHLISECRSCTGVANWRICRFVFLRIRGDEIWMVWKIWTNSGQTIWLHLIHLQLVKELVSRLASPVYWSLRDGDWMADGFISRGFMLRHCFKMNHILDIIRY